MELEKKFNLSLLFDFYGCLLTDKQQEMFRRYYFDDISLGEIADNYGISRQAVRDSLKKAENSLFEYESKLKMLNKYNNMLKVLKSMNISSEKLDEILKVWEG